MTLTTIITPAYKAEPFIHLAVQSVLAQSDPHWEMIIVSDDGQNYKTVLETRGISDKRLTFLTTGAVQTGPSHARNVAQKQAKGEVILFLDADDLLSPNYLSLLSPAALKHGMAKSSLTHRYIEKGGNRDSEAAPIIREGLNSPSCILDYNGQVNMAARKDLLNFEWREDIHFAEDVLFSLQLADSAAGVYYEPKATYYYHIRDGSACNGQHHSSSILTCKQYIRSLVAKDEIKLQNDLLRQDFLNYYDRSIALEFEYVRALQQGVALNFADFATKYREES